MIPRTPLLLVFCFALGAVDRADAQAAPPPVFTPAGDLRAGYFNSHRLERDPSQVTDRDDFRMRIRYGTGIRISEVLSARVRAAGRFSTEQDRFALVLRDHAATYEGLRLGEATLDEAHLHYRPSARLNLRVGRMQTKFALADLMGKSLDRVDSPNTEISWTDGAHLTASMGGGWNAHIIAQHNSARGPTNPLRPPLGFTAEGSRVSWFGALEKASSSATVVQRSLDLTWVPDALPAAAAGGEPRDYVAVVARGFAGWPLGTGGPRLSLGGEVGHAPNTPSRESLRLGPPGSGGTGGTAVQVGSMLSNFLPRHQLGLVYGYTEAGWLIAPDFRNNDHLLELRYRWDFARNRNVDARLRRRQDVEQPLNAGRKRQDTDFYVRFNLRF